MMRFAITAPMILSAALFIPLHLQAETIPGATYSLRELPAPIEAAWKEYRAMQQAGNIAGAAALREKLTAENGLQGVSRFDRFSSVLLQEAGIALSGGETKKAIHLGGEALSWSPNNPDAHFFLAGAHAKEGSFFSSGAIGHYFGGLSSSIRDFWSTYYLLRRLVILFFLALAGSLLIFLALLWLRYTPLWSHTLFETGWLHRPVAWGVILAGPIVLIMSGLGLAIVLSALFSFFWMFMSRGERWISAFILVLLGFSNLWVSPLNSFLAGEGSLSLRLISQVAEGNPSASGTSSDIQARGGYEEDWELIFSMGLQSKREGHFEKAAALYRKAQVLAPNESIIPNNLGTVYLAMKLYQPSIDALRQAVSLDPKNVGAYYNLNLVYQEMLKFEEAGQEYDKAQAINKRLAQGYSDSGRAAVDGVVPEKTLWRRLLSGRGEQAKGSQAVYSGLFSPIAPESSLILLAGSAGLILLFRIILNTKRISIACGLCSRSICFHCQRRMLDLRVCQGCWAANKNIKRKAELQQLNNQMRRGNRLGMVLSLLLPGSGNLYIKQSVMGFVVLFFFMAGLLHFAIGADILPSPGSRNHFPVVGNIVTIVLLISIYLVSFYRSRKPVVKS